MKTRMFLVFSILALSIAPLQAGGPREASLAITVAPDADVQVDGVCVPAEGQVRHFCTEMCAGEIRFVEVRATWCVNGHETSQTQTIGLCGGNHKEVLFNRPT